jgi:hypothetical protein
MLLPFHYPNNFVEFMQVLCIFVHAVIVHPDYAVTTVEKRKTNERDIDLTRA